MFEIKVPKPGAPDPLIIKLVARIRLDVDPSVNGVAFKITDLSDPDGPVVRRLPVAGFYPTTAFQAAGVFFEDQPAGAFANDRATVTAPATPPPASDPNARFFKLTFELRSNYDNDPCCSNTMANDETWRVEAEFQNALLPGQQGIISLCVTSFKAGSNNLSTLQVIKPPEKSATVLNVNAPALSACAEARPGVDVVMVLDKSGSMASTTAGSQPRAKIAALRAAMKDFVEVWDILRTSEGSSAPTDQLGVVTFDADEAWWPVVSTTGLVPFTSTLKNNIVNVITNAADPNNINPGTSTSIGDGLFAANSKLPDDPARREAILLMSDGIQNTDRMAGIKNGKVVTYPQTNPNNTTDLSNQSSIQIYSVTVGVGTAVQPQINEDVAKATKGFYINSEINAEILRAFFLELLQNFLHFNTWETVRLVSGQVELEQVFTTSFPVASTTTQLSINLLWPEELGRLMMRVTSPGDGMVFEDSGQGQIRMQIELPTSDSYDLLGDWKVEIGFVGFGDDHDHGAAGRSIPFDLVVLGEDPGVNADTTIVDTAYAPGDQIELRVHISAFGQPLEKLGDQPGDTMVARVIRPGVSLGDLLSDSKASASSPTPGDPGSAADAKLANELAQNPDALKTVEDIVTLKSVGDGFYSGFYEAREPGHYNFLFGLEGTTPEAGRFSRQQLKTVYVRSKPDAKTTTVQSFVQGSSWLITFIPRTRLEHRLGPGWANYFWFTAPGMTPFKARDNLDGSYTANVWIGAGIPALSLHFLDMSMLIDDEVKADNLPVPLDKSTLLIDTITPSDREKRQRGPSEEEIESVRVLGLLLLLLLIALLIRRLRRIMGRAG